MLHLLHDRHHRDGANMRFAQALDPTTMNCRNASVRHAPTRIDGTTVNQLNSFDSSCPSFTPPAAGSGKRLLFPKRVSNAASSLPAAIGL